jgi:N-[(2S)-2-amino-2-carboxyethyl]-L-glutamate dehydrogenase
MSGNDILILKGGEVQSLLAGREQEIINVVRTAYVAHGKGDSSLPNSTFLRFPAVPQNRIIALPAYLGQEFDVAGVKWVSSFPGNLELGLDRASALVILNSTITGQPQAIIEGSTISAQRTAASAALAAQLLTSGEQGGLTGLVGCGPINFEIVRFLRTSLPESRSFRVFDLDQGRAHGFKRQCQEQFGLMDVEVTKDLRTVISNCSLISFATTAAEPYIADPSVFASGTTILHISLRDLSPEIILSCDNIVDDVEHVCRAQTSIHLAEQLAGNRSFIRCTLADILRGKSPARKNDASVAVFSPFGLGVLDIAVGKFVCDLAISQGRGTAINSFLPASWTETNKQIPA